MSISSNRIFGHMNVIHKDGGLLELNFKYIPAIDEVGIGMASNVNAAHSCWVDLTASDEEALSEINNEIGDWAIDGEAERILSDIKEWVSK